MAKVTLQNGQVGVPTKYVSIFENEETHEFDVRRIKDGWRVASKLSEFDARHWAESSGYVVIDT